VKKILISGGTGFIGRHAIPFLVKQGYEIHVLQRHFSDSSSREGAYFHVIPEDAAKFISLLTNIKPDGIIHLATLFQASHKPEQIENMISANVTLGSMLLEAASKLHSVWFLNTGTYWQHINAQQYNPVNLYAATKQAFETIAVYYYQNYPINFLTLCLNDTYGPHDSRPKIFNLWKKQLSSDSYLDMTAGEQILDILYISDVLDAIKKCIFLLEEYNSQKLKGKIFFATAEEKYTLRETAAIFEQISGKNLRINWGAKPYRQKEIMVPECFGTPIPDWHSQVTLKQGIRKFLNDD
jgi:nucleoside-diphosphate-sugar epimerase